MTIKDVTGFLRVEISRFSPDLGGMSLLNCTEKLENRNSNGENFPKNPVKTALRDCQFLSLHIVKRVLLDLLLVWGLGVDSCQTDREGGKAGRCHAWEVYFCPCSLRFPCPFPFFLFVLLVRFFEGSQTWWFPHLVACNSYVEALFCVICMFLRPTAFQTTAFGNIKVFPFFPRVLRNSEERKDPFCFGGGFWWFSLVFSFFCQNNKRKTIRLGWSIEASKPYNLTIPRLPARQRERERDSRSNEGGDAKVLSAMEVPILQGLSSRHWPFWGPKPH